MEGTGWRGIDAQFPTGLPQFRIEFQRELGFDQEGHAVPQVTVSMFEK
jgi:hypothetical protein